MISANMHSCMMVALRSRVNIVSFNDFTSTIILYSEDFYPTATYALLSKLSMVIVPSVS